MPKSTYKIYVDESGDEGFIFKGDGSGSSKWFVLSALMIRSVNDLKLVHSLAGVRQKLHKAPNKQIHFRDLKHEQRKPYVREIAQLPIRTASVLIYKPAINEPERFRAEPYLLYHYATRYLLERVSWLCRDHRSPSDEGNGAEIIFSNRSSMSYSDLRNYLCLLKEKADPMDVRIEWSEVSPERVCAKNHDQMAGLQMADAISTSLFYSVRRDAYGETEDGYAKILKPTFYKHKGTILGYGLKFWPHDFASLKTQNPHLAGFADWLEKE